MKSVLVGVVGVMCALGAVLVAGCSGTGAGISSDGGTSGSSGSSGNGGSSGTSGNGGSSGTSGTAALGPACSQETPCPNWFCDCASGPPVNATNCDNGHCATAANTCPSSCAKFGTTWLGTAGGGWSGGSSSGSSGSSGGKGCGDGTTFTDLGNTCLAPSECQASSCVGTSQHSFCSKSCGSSDNCPKGWVCGQLAGETTKACLLGDLNKTSPQSTNASCADRAFSDTGNPCTSYTQCQSEICGGSTVISQRYCTKRCNSAADCPAAFTCGTGTGDTFKTCRK